MKIFITGNSRSGTTMLSRILGNHPDVFTFQELHFFDEIINPAKAAAVPGKQEAVNLFARLCSLQRNGYFGSRDPAPFLAYANETLPDVPGRSYLDIYDTFLHTETSRNGKSIPCEQTPQNLFAIDILRARFPDARFIIMVRDPREVLLSQKNKWRRRKLSGGKIPLWEAIRVRINYHPVTISKIWNQVMTEAERVVHHPAVLLVKYEDLLMRPEVVVQKICDHCGIAFSTALLDIPVTGSSNFLDQDAARGIDPSRLHQWENGGLNASEIHICEQITGARMRKYGYALKNGNPSVMRLFLYKIILPFQLVLALLFNLKRLKHLKKLLHSNGFLSLKGSA